MINPILQPTGKFRLINWLDDCFLSPDYSDFKCAVAFAKAGPLYKLDASFRIWKGSHKTSMAILGVDHKGTSLQALSYILRNYDTSYLIHANYSTFHPKLYLFVGEHKACVFYGSNNMTPGGTETNFEGGILLNLELPVDATLLAQCENCFHSMLPENLSCSAVLTEKLIDILYQGNYLLDESLPKERTITVKGAVANVGTRINTNQAFGKFSSKPPRTMVKAILEKFKAMRESPSENPGEQDVTLKASMVPAKGLVIQIVPHYNGEVFLSKRAIDQNPAFFGFPFTGKTNPKKATNASYPQREPDPVVNIFIYDTKGSLDRTVNNYSLNTVFYESKSEIRITISPDILSSVKEYSILVMTISNTTNCDYDLTIFNPGSTEYVQYLALCDQQLPSGGKDISRKMGWI